MDIPLLLRRLVPTSGILPLLTACSEKTGPGNERRNKMNTWTQRQAAALQDGNLSDLNTARSASASAPLSELSQVTFISDNVFLKGIGEVERLVKAAQPVHLPMSGRYSIEVKEGKLHVHAANGIQDFEVVDPNGKVRGVRQNAEAINIEIETDAGRISVVLHRDASERPQKSARRQANRTQTDSPLSVVSSSSSHTLHSRTSSPWTYAASEPASESRGGGRCNGER
jgi:hypothetical protein